MTDVDLFGPVPELPADQQEIVFNVCEFVDEIIPDGNGPKLIDCARFLMEGEPTDNGCGWPGPGPLAKPGELVKIYKRHITWRKYYPGKIYPDFDMVAIPFGKGKGWSPDDIFPDLDSLLSECDDEIYEGDWLAFDKSETQTYLFNLTDGKPSLTLVAPPLDGPSGA